jgi:hypothetical protein
MSRGAPYTHRSKAYKQVLGRREGLATRGEAHHDGRLARRGVERLGVEQVSPGQEGAEPARGAGAGRRPRPSLPGSTRGWVVTLL